jgi:branched-chain amino acid transport system permease protein
LFYLGLFFVVVVVGSPDGLAGFAARASARLARDGWRACWRPSLLLIFSALSWTLAVVLAVQWAYAMQSSDEVAGNVVQIGNVTIGSAASVAALLAVIAVLALAGWFTWRRAQYTWARYDSTSDANANTGAAQ